MCPAAWARSYSTNFPLNESSISENGAWVEGSTTGNWTNMQSVGGFAYGTCGASGSGCFGGTGSPNDSTALMTGSWGANQTVTIKVHQPGPLSGQPEVEIRLRSTFGANSSTGYEVDMSAGFFVVVKWAGPVSGPFTQIANFGSSVADGDVVTAMITGTSSTVITVYKNGTLVGTVTDSSSPFTSGNPGMGWFISSGGTPSNADSISYFSATDAPTYLAASCSRTDVNAVINGPTHTAIAGDNIIIPAGACTWTSGITVTVPITIQGTGIANSGTSQFGAGTLQTVITDNIAGNPLISAQVSYVANSLMRVSALDIEPGSTGTALVSPLQFAGTCTSSGCPNIRVDNIGLGLTTHWSGATWSQATWLIRSDNVFGVVDHNTEPTGSDAVFADNELSAYLGVGGFGDNSWAQPDTFGGGNAIYYENNSIYVTRSITDCEVAPVGGAIGGCRSVGRFNHITSNNGFGGWGLHGLDTDGRPQSGRQLEVYGNAVTCTNNSCNIIAGYRGGTGYTFGNTLTETGTGFFNSFASIAVYRTVFTAGGGWGACGGSSPYDVNDGVVYFTGTTTSGSSGLTMNDTTKSWTTNQLIPTGAPYSVHDITQGWWAEIASNTATSITIQGSIPEQTNSFAVGDSYEILRATVCADQGGRGQGNLVSGTPPSPSASLAQALDPIYEWNDSESPVRLNANMQTDTGRTIANRDWYTDDSMGTPHVQTSPTSPFTGATGVGFGTLANRPTSCTPHVGYFATDQGTWNTSNNGFGQGVLYTCSSTNTWTSTYTPYSYPHPLISGSTSGGVSPSGLSGPIKLSGQVRVN